MTETEFQQRDGESISQHRDRLASVIGTQQAEIDRLQREYALLDELSPPDVPRQTFVRWCLDAWEEKCERERGCSKLRKGGSDVI